MDNLGRDMELMMKIGAVLVFLFGLAVGAVCILLISKVFR